MTERPRFRQDLVAEPIDDGGKRFIDVADPDSGSVFRFYEVEYSLACAMDGERDVIGIARWAQEELGLSPSAKEIISVIATLGELGYLERGAAAAATSEPKAANWEQPTTIGSTEGYLASGVVAAHRQAASHPPADDVELGRAGGVARSSPEAATAAVDLELGAPGAAAPRRGGALQKGEDIPLGVSGRVSEPEIETSVDLSTEVAVRADDVKEAVRASQVMRSVDVPKELLESIEPVIKAPTASETRPASRPAQDAKPAAAKPEPKRPEPRVAARPKAPLEQPKPIASKAPTAPRRGVSPLLVLALAVVAIAAATFFVYKYVIERSDDHVRVEPASRPIVPPNPPEPPPPPPVESTALATEQAGDQDVKPATAGQLETLVANGSSVKLGMVVASLAGHKPLETELASLRHDIDKRVFVEIAQAEKDRDTAQTAGNAAGVTTAEARLADRKKILDDKRAKLAAKEAELDKYLAKAPVAGKVVVVARLYARVTPNDVVAKIRPDPMLVATFKSAGTATGKVLLAVKGSDQKLSCTVTSSDVAGVKIACPHDAVAEGTEVTFAGPDSTPPTPPAAGSGAGAGEIEMGEDGSAGAAKAAAPVEAPPPPAPAPAPPRPHPVLRRPPHPQPKPPLDAGSDKAGGSDQAPAVAPPPAGSAAPPTTMP